jgi:DNA transformation protein
MSASPGFITLLEDLLRPLGPITVRRMFGGAGVYCDGLFFAIVDDDTLYLKTDEKGRAAFAAEGMGPFTYMTKDGPGTLMTYWRAPERLFDDSEDMIAWARQALDAAHRAAAKKQGGARPSSGRGGDGRGGRGTTSGAPKKSTRPRP